MQHYPYRFVCCVLLGFLVMIFSAWFSGITISCLNNDKCWSINEAKSDGSFVAEVLFSPGETFFGSRKISFREAWIEQRREREDYWGILARYKLTGDYYLCFTLDEGEEIFLEHGNPFFVLDDNGRGFEVNYASNSPILFREIVKTSELYDQRMSILQAWSENRHKNIRLSTIRN